MRKSKKLLAFALAAAMVMGMGAPAYAEETTGRIDSVTVNGTTTQAVKGSITISNAMPGETYRAYKLLTLASFADSGADPEEYLAADHHSTDRYSYVIEAGSAWLPFFVSGAGKTYFDVDQANPVTINGKTYYIVTAKDNFKNAATDHADGTHENDETSINEWASGSLVQKFAQDALKFAQDENNHVAAEATKTADSSASGAGEAATGTETVSLSLGTAFELGYYLVDSTLGALCSLDTTNTNMTIVDKSDLPKVDKDVQEDGAATADDGDRISSYQNVNDATIGDYVYYKTVIDVKKGAQNYVLHDTMTEGLTYYDAALGSDNAKEATQVFLVPSADALGADNTDAWMNLTAAGTAVKLGEASYDTSKGLYTLKAPAAHDGGADHTFDIEFDQDFTTWVSDQIKAAADNYYLVVTYAATLNEKAAIEGQNKNTTSLTYGDSSTTNESVTSTYTWPIQIYKYEKNGETKSALAGAVFELYDSVEGEPDHIGSRLFKFVELKAGDKGYDAQKAAGVPQYEVIAKGQEANIQGEDPDATLALDWNGDGTAEEKAVLTQIMSGTTGKFYIVGLDEGTYHLKETAAPAGFNKLPYPVKITVNSNTAAQTDETASNAKVTGISYVSAATADENGVLDYDDNEIAISESNAIRASAPIEIENKSGVELPSTGGIGTTIFYMMGSILVVGAGLILVAKRRMNLV